MKVFCHASNTTCLSYLKKHHNQFREKYVHMSKLDLLMRHLPIYAYRGLRLRAFFLPLGSCCSAWTELTLAGLCDN